MYDYMWNQCLSQLKVVSSNPTLGDVYSIQRYVIKFVSDLGQVGGILRVLRVSSTNNTYLHDITEMLLKVVLTKVALNTNA
jgi:hypothetical protein